MYNCLEWYLINFSTLDLLKDLFSSKETFLLSRDYLTEIRDLTRVYGVKFLYNKIFYGVSDVKQAIDIRYRKNKDFETASLKMSTLLSSLTGGSKPSTSSIMNTLNDVLKLYPDCLTAIVLKEALTGKLPTKISYQSSYVEASHFANIIFNRNAAEHDLDEIKRDLQQVQKYVHTDFKKMIALSLESISDLITLEKTPKKEAKAGKGNNILTKTIDIHEKLTQKIYKNVRLIKYEREKILDKQENVERLY